MTMRPHAVIRADASADIGGGHVMRCLALASALVEDGWQVTFAVSRETAVTVPALRRSRLRCITLENPSDPADLNAVGDCDLLVVDHYGLDRAYEGACRPWAKRIMAIDDLADRRHDCDVLLDQTLGRTAADYGGRVPARCTMLLGSGFALLRPSFAQERSRRSKKECAGRVLIAMGTADTGHKLVPLIEALAGIPETLDVVVGAVTPHLAAIKKAAQGADANLHVDAVDVERLMAGADLAVLAAGTTVWEAACLGVPAILLVTASNQTEIAARMEAANAAIVARDVEDAAAHVARLVKDHVARKILALQASAICDGYGAPRVALALKPEHSTDGRDVTLRAVRPDDAAIMLQWQKRPATRRFARNPAGPTEAEHLQWFARKLADPRCIFNMIDCDGESAGVLRLDRTESGKELEVSILTAPKHQRRGIALAALRLAHRLVPHESLLANVLEGNMASQRLFERAGYDAVGRGWFKQERAVCAPVVA